jgi:pimeloyl-ACP methyl ester carboxylesterase
VSEDPHPPAGAAQAWATSAVSIVNGFFGDYLTARQNGLAIDMAFYHHHQPLPLTRASLLRVHPQPTGKVCVLVHGLAGHEGVWTFPDPADSARTTSYGALLHSEHGYAPLFLRYNSGLPIWSNGQRLAALLDELLAGYPAPVQDLLLIGHSMGGLVLRSACHYGLQQQLPWVTRVSRVFYLGTPHDGADLERLAHVATTALQAVPNPITRIIGGFLGQRSQGVKDLRYGALLAPDGAAQPAQSQPEAPWLAAAEHFLMAGTLTSDAQHPATLFFGDGLVRVSGAVAVKGRPPAPAAQVHVLPRVHHLQLTRDQEVYEQISAWCSRAPQE